MWSISWIFPKSTRITETKVAVSRPSVPGAGGGQRARLPDHLGLSQAPPGGAERDVPASAAAGAGIGGHEAGASGAGRDQDQSQRQQAQGDELPTDGRERRATPARGGGIAGPSPSRR